MTDDTVKKVAEAIRDEMLCVSDYQISEWSAEIIARAAISAMSGWRPIETAPNDETILVYYDDWSTQLIEEDENQYDWKPYKKHALGSTPKYWCYPPSPPGGRVMADHPILFSGSMVRAILREIEKPGSGKTQTRRVVKPQPTVHPNGAWSWEGRHGGFVGAAGTHVEEGFPESARYWCRVQPGARLWVREAWHAARSLDKTAPRDIPRDADIEHAATARSYAEIGLKGKLRPSMFMPRWASRLTLYVTDVRVQRLQDISEADAEAEGVCVGLHDFDCVGGYFPDPAGYCSNGCGSCSYREVYQRLWNSINGPGAWEANPWVVAYTFVPCLGNIDTLPATLQEAA